MVNSKRHRLTKSSTLHFFGRDREDVYYLDHDYDDCVRHSCSRCKASVYVEPLKETFDAVEDINEHVLTRAGIVSRLGALSVKDRRPQGTVRTLTERRTPIPAKIMSTGRNAWKVNIRIEISPQRKVLIFTSPTTWPRVSENAFRTFIVGMTHFDIWSSPFWDWLNVGNCSRKTERISSGESQC
jgi:hypothetical protein